jgi:hypothetical protein
MDGAEARGFVDGQMRQVSPVNQVPTPNNNNVRIGLGNSGAFLGLIDDVRIYDRALSGEEVEALANGTL